MRFNNLFTDQYQSEILGREGSQHGEEGIIREILKRLEIDSGWVADVGAWDGKCFNNVFFLVKTGKYNAIEIEGDPLRYEGLLTNVKEYPNMTPLNKKVAIDGEDSLDNLFKGTEITKDFEVLNIDIDSYDYQVWENLLEYSPKVAIVEFNPRFHAKEHVNDREYNREDHVNYGSSFVSLCKLGEKKGYTFVCCCGCNMIFVRDDQFPKLNLDKELLKKQALKE